MMNKLIVISPEKLKRLQQNAIRENIQTDSTENNLPLHVTKSDDKPQHQSHTTKSDKNRTIPPGIPATSPTDNVYEDNGESNITTKEDVNIWKKMWQSI